MDLEHLEITLHTWAHFVSLAIETCAVFFIAAGALGALLKISGIWMARSSRNLDYQRRAVWLTFARWLVAGLTFQLAADIVNTSFSPTWEELGHLGAIAVIRTFLNYFLGREVEEKVELQEDSLKEGAHKRSA
ncbi:MULTISPECIES: DUF1622 domain-containing protein [unclassified Variovorax]|uniref:DUF1622 domain-containing protein n=1 Tax=unclassified Variovorax TaxID=663243 RepID=UPI001BD66292|nr:MULTISPECIES: DUF1622 domain-containing protein [unclassified Variovorax]